MCKSVPVAIHSLLPNLLCGAFAALADGQAPPVPKIDGAFWQVAGNPALGDLGSPAQQPADFSIWQATDGTWQPWSCIRNTACGGATRLFHRWQGNRITDSNWTPIGVAMQADPRLGKIPGGLQAPHVFRAKGRFYMVYGDWLRICLATSCRRPRSAEASPLSAVTLRRCEKMLSDRSSPTTTARWIWFS